MVPVRESLLSQQLATHSKYSWPPFLCIKLIFFHLVLFFVDARCGRSCPLLGALRVFSWSCQRSSFTLHGYDYEADMNDKNEMLNLVIWSVGEGKGYKYDRYFYFYFWSCRFVGASMREMHAWLVRLLWMVTQIRKIMKWSKGETTKQKNATRMLMLVTSDCRLVC